jgi:hypothetical protein
MLQGIMVFSLNFFQNQTGVLKEVQYVTYIEGFQNEGLVLKEVQ